MDRMPTDSRRAGVLLCERIRGGSAIYTWDSIMTDGAVNDIKLRSAFGEITAIVCNHCYNG